MFRLLPTVLVVFCTFFPKAYGDVQLSIQSGASFVENSGIQTLSLLANSNASDQLLSLTADLQLAGGSFEAVPGTYGQLGFIGAGNLDATSDFQRDAGDSAFSYLSLEFTNDQLIPNSDQTLATLAFNINGLLPGVYNISFSMLDAQGLSGPISIGGTLGSFTITAVPEPTSIVPAIILGAVGCLRRRKRKGRSKKHAAGTGMA